jgi:DNA-binding MarR family transcriptional regulator
MPGVTDDDGTVPFADSLPFLVSQVGARVAELFAQRLAPLRVTPRAYAVMSHLAREAGQTQQRLSDLLGIHRNSMVALIDELEAAGWVRRHRSAQDRRAFELRLTPAGVALLARIDGLQAELEREVGGGLSATEHEKLVALLGQLAQSLGLARGMHPSLRR